MAHAAAPYGGVGTQEILNETAAASMIQAMFRGTYVRNHMSSVRVRGGTCASIPALIPLCLSFVLPAHGIQQRAQA